MKPAFAVRETTCYKCHEPILPGERRLDDIIKKPKFLRRIHYHPACAWMRFMEWWDNNEGRPSPMARGGSGIPSPYSEEEKQLRAKALHRLRTLTNYWVDKLNVRTPFDQLTDKEKRQFINFKLQCEEHIKVLAVTGGVPDRYAGLLSGMEVSVAFNDPGDVEEDDAAVDYDTESDDVLVGA